jgi:hypothetical protein
MEGSRLELTITGFWDGAVLGGFEMKCKRGQKKMKNGEVYVF